MEEYSYLDQEAVELLSATVIRTAYEDLLEAYLVDAAMEFHEISFNCDKLYKQLVPKPGHYNYSARNGGYGRSEAEISKTAKREIQKLTHWFLHSERCRMMLKAAKPEWFVERAKEKAMLFALDKITITETRVYMNRVEGQTDRSHRRHAAKWKKARDKWREEHNMRGVD